MSKHSEDTTPEQPATPPTAETPATPPPAAAPVAAAPKSGRGKLAAIAGGAAAIGLIIGLGIGWLGFSDGHDEGRRGGPSMSQQMPGGRGQMGGDDQMPQSRGGSHGGGGHGGGGGRMMPGGPGQQLPDGPQTQDNQSVPNAKGGTTQQTPQTLPGAVIPN